MSSEEETDFETWAAYRRAKRTGGKKKRKGRDVRESKKKVKGGGQTLNGRGPECDRDHHLAPKCPLRNNPRNESVPLSPCLSKVPRPPYSSVSMELPVGARDNGSSAKRAGAEITSNLFRPL